MTCPFHMTECFDGCTRCHEGPQETKYKISQRGGRAGGYAAAMAARKRKRAKKESMKVA